MWWRTQKTSVKYFVKLYSAMTSPKIVIVGAGGYVFPLRLAMDILSFPELQSAKLTLYDIHEGRLKRCAGPIM
jgi:alpha-galactosidase/6-phospho-beta-glucosidase family protein